MKRFCLLVVVAMVGLTLGALPASADGACPSGFDTGGNGWCADGMGFRAWQVDSGIELTWVVTAEGDQVSIVRQVSGGAGAPVEVATSAAAGVFTTVDEGVAGGRLYAYQVLLDGAEVGDVIEAGVAATYVPGDDDSYHLYIPLALGLR